MTVLLDCASRKEQEIFKVMNSKNLQPKIIYPAKLSLRIEGQIKSFTNKKIKKAKGVHHRQLYELLKGLL